MTSIDKKKGWIIAYERQLAVSVSSQIIDKPKLTIWMILVPVIFVYFFITFKNIVAAARSLLNIS